MEYHMGSANEKPENYNRVLREKPPRYLSTTSKLIILFGGISQQMGWLFWGFGMIFFWIFVMNSEAKYLFSFDGKWVDSNGVIVDIYSTDAEVNDQEVFAYEFTYDVQGRTLKSVSYRTTPFERYEENAVVKVQYKSRNPKRARIEGMSSSIFSYWVVFVCIFPIIGLAFIANGLFYNLRALHLLIHGQFTKGKLENKIPTTTSVDNQTVFKYEFKFEADGQEYLAFCRTHQGWKIENEELEIILYNVNDPKSAVVYDAIPSAPEITPRGELDAVPAYRITNLILPILAIGVNFLFYYFSVYDLI